MTVLFTDIQKNVIAESEFAFLASQRDENKIFQEFSHDKAGIEAQRAMLASLWRNMMAFLSRRFPTLTESQRADWCELQLHPLDERITANEHWYEFYGSVRARLSSM